MFEFIWFIVGCMVAGLIISSINLQCGINNHLAEAQKRFDNSLDAVKGLDND